MGAADRQVGHVAIASTALLGGIGVAWLGGRVRPRALYAVSCCALAVFIVSRVPRAELADGHAAGELLGSGGPIASVPARALIVCTNDDACAAGLFALAVEAVRPDVDVVPGQHLWDATVLRNVDGIPRLKIATPPPAQRPAAMRRALQILLESPAPRPVLFELPDPLRFAGLRDALVASNAMPYLTSVDARERAASIGTPLAQLDRARAARLRASTPRSERARYAWSQVYSTLGESALGTPDAVRALHAAVSLAPERATAWTNLSVALERNGELAPALASAQRAVALAPERPTPWVNLARLHIALGDPDAARAVLDLARNAGVRDARLDQLARDLAH
jgi:tetratricopeptide (TPR) repeat protein